MFFCALQGNKDDKPTTANACVVLAYRDILFRTMLRVVEIIRLL